MVIGFFLPRIGSFAADFRGLNTDLFFVKTMNNAVFVFKPICVYLCVSKSKVKSISLSESAEHTEKSNYF